MDVLLLYNIFVVLINQFNKGKKMNKPYYSIKKTLTYNNTVMINVFNEHHMRIEAITQILKGKNKGKVIETTKYGYDKDQRLMSIVIVSGKRITTLTKSKLERERTGTPEYSYEKSLANF